MLANERQSKICEMLNMHEAVTTSELVERFGVSIETIRRDLLYLEREHKLQRVHGGALTVGETKPFHTLSYRTEENIEQKHELGAIASRFVKNGDSIAVDEGSTAIEFALALKDNDELDTLTVATHSLDVFNLLCRHRNFKLILCGGFFLPSENAFCGQFVIDQYRRFRMDKAFVFPYAVSLKYGICDHQPELHEIQRVLLEIATWVFVLADSSKFERGALLKLSDMNREYTYVTDSALPDKLLALYRENGIDICTSQSDSIERNNHK